MLFFRPMKIPHAPEELTVMTQVNWIKCQTDWCSLKNLNLSSILPNAAGVYIIWHEGDPARAVYVGQGNFRQRFSDHRNSPEILQYADIGTLRVTWASVPESERDGIERFLADHYQPLEGDEHPEVDPISVNLPE